MNIYVVTENTFFYLGIKEKLTGNGHIIKKIDPLEFKITQMDKFKSTDTFIFHTVNHAIELSFLLVTGKLPGRIIFTQTKRKALRVSMFGKYRTLDYNEGVDMLINELNDEIDDSEQLLYGCKQLTERESIVLSYVMEGMKVSTISSLLCISTKTVYAHRKNAMNKLGGRNVFEILPLRECVLKSVFSKAIPC
ncbi:helix-turn-helix domain-containing protein [Serratia fonticola]|uniref:helix-turn-helix domain-containing protein n=1 Tax=Serratia fonticola TaxID=47917 RepID=UPI0013781BAA|nr:helix-turn-helix transcriptional regulator [Serratia fonticola]NCG54965.1 hypothetical protein [Serratia fonticola]